MTNNETPRYALLLYGAREKLGVTIAEYFFLDMVHKLSYNRWCNKSIENCARDMGISKRGLLKMRDRLLKRGYLKKSDKGYLKVTTSYLNIAVNKVPESVNLVHSIGELSSPKNNNRITKKEKGLSVDKTVDNRGQYSRTTESIKEIIDKKGVKALKQLALTGG